MYICIAATSKENSVLLRGTIHTFFSELMLVRVSSPTTSVLKPPNFDGDSDPDDVPSRDPKVTFGAAICWSVVVVRSGLVRKFTVGRD